MKKLIALILSLSVCALLFGCSAEDLYTVIEEYETYTQTETVPVDGELKITVLDVGQGDSILINFPDGKTALIDSGEEAYISDKLKDYGVTVIDYLVATHPHSDHIGRMGDIIRKFEIGDIYMPKASNDSKQYYHFLSAMKTKGEKATEARAGVVMAEGEGYRAEFVAPNSDHYEDLNNYSAVLYITYGENSFIFMGDAEKESEYEIMDNYNIKADVIKVGHHGSYTSSAKSFIEMLDPSFALISCGTGNSYGHPHKETIKTLKDMAVLRTDLEGDIVITSDGYNIYAD